MMTLAQDIRNQTYKRIYLLYGEEAYLLRQYRDKLRDALVSADDTLNYYYHQGKGVEIGQIIDMAETMPFMSEKRVILLENPSLNTDDSGRLAEYAESIPDSTVIILVENEADKRTKLYKAIAKHGRCVEFTTQNEATLKKWIAGKIKAAGKNTRERTLDVLLSYVGTDMTNIQGELSKLLSYVGDREIIEEEDIRAICTPSPNSEVFDMIDLISGRETSKALDMYHELIAMKQSPFGIIALIARQFNIMLQIAELKAKRYTPKEIADRMSMSPYICGKYMDKLGGFTTEQMKQFVIRCGETDEAIKKGNIEAVLGVEILIIEGSKA